MNILVNKLPTKVHVGGREFEVNYGFKAFILVELCFSSKERSDYQKQMDALNLFYKGNIPDDIVKATEKLIWFYRCGKQDRATNKTAAAKKAVRAYDFEQDQYLIYAAFKQQYGISITELKNEDMHWWEFRALFDGLTDTTHFGKVMAFRTIDISNMKGSQRKYYQSMKSLYSLRDESESVDSKMALAKRDAEMKAYIERRYKEVGNVVKSSN